MLCSLPWESSLIACLGLDQCDSSDWHFYLPLFRLSSKEFFSFGKLYKVHLITDIQITSFFFSFQGRYWSECRGANTGLYHSNSTGENTSYAVSSLPPSHGAAFCWMGFPNVWNMFAWRGERLHRSWNNSRDTGYRKLPNRKVGGTSNSQTTIPCSYEKYFGWLPQS